jgi:hypothetical protein
LYAVMTCSGRVPSPLSSKATLSVQFLTLGVLACRREPVISMHGSQWHKSATSDETTGAEVAVTRSRRLSATLEIVQAEFVVHLQ